MLRNPMTIKPHEIRAGNVVMAVTVTCHVVKCGNETVYRLYRCAYPPDTYDGTPQGSRIGNEEEVAEQLFPVVTWSDVEPDVL